MTDKSKTVYIVLTADHFNEGHLKLITKGRQLGNVIIGLLSDRALANNTRIPFFDFDHRKMILENIKGVCSVIKEDTLDFSESILKLKPDFFIYSEDLQFANQKNIRSTIVKSLNKVSGQFIDVSIEKTPSASSLIEEAHRFGVTPEIRRSRLKRLLSSKDIVRVLESHNGLSALIAENTKVTSEDYRIKEFDAIWMSSLTDSTARGKPDIELVSTSARVATIEEVMEVTNKPIIYDGDTGGRIEHFVFTIRTLERMGVSAIIIEDKVGPKRNSLFGATQGQRQETIENFCEKISSGKRAQLTRDFMVIARVESLILEKGSKDALDRSFAYVDAGADAIMIHSKSDSFNEVKNFTASFRKINRDTPIVVVPSTFNKVQEKELIECGINVVIYANQLIRAAYPAMLKAAQMILSDESAKNADRVCMPINEIISLIPIGDTLD